MVSQYNLAQTMVSATAINAQHIQVNHKFAKTVDLRIAAELSVMLDGPPELS